MAIQDDTRIWRGAVLSVRNDVEGQDNAWVDFANCIDYSMPSAAAAKIDASTAGSSVDQFRLGLRDNGSATFNVFDYMDSAFLAAMYDMHTNSETRKFKLVIPEGTRTTRIFTGYVIDTPIAGQYNSLWKMTLNLKVEDDFWWLYPIPTLSARSPTSDVAAGGATVTLTGTNFEDGLTSVLIGGNTVEAEDVTVLSSTSLTFVTPAHAAGSVTISVTTPVGTSGTVAFTYT